METVCMVEWADAHQATDSWTSVDELESDGARIIRTVGFLLSVDDGGKRDHVTIVQSFDEDQQMVDNVLHIPTAMVRNIRVVSFDLLSGASLQRFV